MSERDELIAKARDLDRRLPEGPWQVEGVSGGQADIADNRGNWIATIRKDFDGTDDPLIIELRTLLPALADLAESEGRRADEAVRERDVLRRDLAGVCENVGLARAEAADYRRTLTDIAQELEKAGIPAHVNVPGLTITYGLSDRVEQLAGQRDAALAELAALKGQVESMRPVVEAVRELLAAKVAMLSAISADFMSEARLKYLRKLSKVESLDLPPKEQP